MSLVYTILIRMLPSLGKLYGKYYRIALMKRVAKHEGKRARIEVYLYNVRMYIFRVRVAICIVIISSLDILGF